MAAMKTLEPALSDELHAKVTTRARRADRLQRDAVAARAAGRAGPVGVRQSLSPRPGGSRAQLAPLTGHRSATITARHEEGELERAAYGDGSPVHRHTRT